MKTAILIQKTNNLIEQLNSKQQTIARKFVIDPNYNIEPINFRNNDEVFIRDLKTRELFHFVSFIKSKCNCE